MYVPHLIYKYLFMATFGAFFVSGFLLGNAATGLVTHSLPAEVSPSLAVVVMICLLIATGIAIPLARRLLAFMKGSAIYGDFGSTFWLVLIIVSWLGGIAFGSLLPGGPFTT